jgi:hypothetical protein
MKDISELCGSSSPSHPHSVFYFGSETARFATVFQSHGLIVQ